MPDYVFAAESVPRPSTRDRFLAFAFAAADILIELSDDSRIRFAAGALRAHLGIDPDSLVGQPVSRLIAKEDHAALDMALALLPIRGRLAPMTVRLASPDRAPMALSALALPGPPLHMCLTFARLPQDAILPGPAIGGDFAQAAEARLRGSGEGTVGLMELRGLGEAKTRLPDETRRGIHAEIVELLRDQAGPTALASELSDGRFGVVSADELDMTDLAARVKRLLHVMPAGRSTRVDGINLALASGLSVQQSVRALRFALKKFSDSGLAATQRYGFRDGLAGFVSSANERAEAARECIAARRFRLAFQPIVHLASGATHHFEALLRPIPTPLLPYDSAYDFVTFVEAVGLSEELDRAVVTQTIAAVTDARESSIAVNISGMSLQNPDFVPRVLAAIRADPVVDGRLLVELTETADIEHPAIVANGLAQLRAAQIPICIDDFGAGAAAFRYLREFPTDFVKIDGAFIHNAAQNTRDSGFVVSMVELANWVGAKTIGEKIETEEHARLVRDLGVEFGQGWLFGRPGALPGST